ncbi:MAG: hypothetical protein IIX62_01385 [Peptococcaceae bacterium]|nr:hypothetical protein [Peptococcaceae bacterium]
MQSTLEPVENNLVTVMPEQTPNPWDPAIPPETVEETITCYVPNDVGNARRFLDACGKEVRYCAAEEQWYAFDGVQWKPVSVTHIERMAYQELEESYLREAQYFKERNAFGYMDSLQKQAAKRGVESGNTRTIKACVKAAAFMNIIEPEEFNNDPYWFHAKNGALSLKPTYIHNEDEKIIQLESFLYHKPEQYFTQTANVNLHDFEEDETYDLQCHNWMRFVAVCAGGNIDVYHYLQKAAAYSVLTGDISEQKIFCLLGAGRNGKSLFINTLAEIAGDYACKIDASLLCRTKFNEQNPDTAKELYRMKGKRFVYTNEFGSSDTLNAQLFKAITDGGNITARQLYSAAIEYKPTCKLWFSTNHMPNLQSVDEGIRRRIVVIPFPIQIPEDKIDRSLADKLRAEYDAILMWLVFGYINYLEEGLVAPDVIKNATAGYFEEQDVLLRFLNENYVIDENSKIAARTLYQHYQAWCAENGETAVSNNKFGMEMTRLGVKKEKGRTNRFYYLSDKAEPQS